MLSGILIEGLIYGIMVLGVFMTFRVLNFCDMTVDGSFPLGACVLAASLVHGVHPVIALIFAFVAGCIAGLITTLIYTKLRLPDLLAGILTMTMLYSVNLRIMSNQSNISFLKIPTAFSKITLFMRSHFPNVDSDWGIVVFLVVFVALLLLALDLFFSTDFGLTMGALGSNEQMVISQGVDPRFVRCVGICFGDGLAAMSGAMFAMYAGFADVGSGTGIVVSGLASLMLGEFILKSNRIGVQTLRVLIGSIIYRALMFLARRYGFVIGMNPNDLKLITGILIIVCLIVSKTSITGYFKKHLSRPNS
ncbi:MAG: ABC transporter permease [Treponema sp.]|nr:ABC transporter permease [Treponema sp.]